MIAEGPRDQPATSAITSAKRSGAAIGEFIREQRQQGQVSLRQLARLAGVSNPYLSQIERGLRISAEQLYVRAGILEFREGNQELVASIIGDPDLAERQKQVLLDIYESFRRENAQLRAEAGTPAAASSEPTAAPAAAE
ncbi:MAG TPA: helix-turn-helix transcriptional regulator [Sporichthyaceae bacterium]|nr:helix-turn-helix transcriptional regulator [Sporichthyaceae bacterium]